MISQFKQIAAYDPAARERDFADAVAAIAGDHDQISSLAIESAQQVSHQGPNEVDSDLIHRNR